MRSEDFNVRTSFQSQYAFHQATNRPCTRYSVYNAEGKRKRKIKYFSKDYPFKSPESFAEYDLWVVPMFGAGTDPHPPLWSVIPPIYLRSAWDGGWGLW